MSDITGDAVRELLDAGAADVLTTFDQLRARPRRVRGTVQLADVRSWRDYFTKHHTPTSEVYADVDRASITAVLDAPAEATASTDERPGWGQHRAVLQLQASPSWKAWREHDGKFFGQVEMAEHIEARSPDLVRPDAATMLEIAQSIKATTGGQFESGSSLHSGARTLRYIENIEGRAGQRGDLEIPTEIELRLQPWRGVPIVVPVTARFRYRISHGTLLLGYLLDRIEDVQDAAWASLVEELGDGLGFPVLAGTAPSYAG